MKLKKRIYLLTPLLVLVCAVAAGVFMKAPAKVEAEDQIFVKGNYEPMTMQEAIELSGNDRYSIKTFDSYLFDYNGEEWNEFWYYRKSSGFLAFTSGNVKGTYTSASNSTKTNDLKTETNADGTKNLNAGTGGQAAQGLVGSKLSGGLPYASKNAFGGSSEIPWLGTLFGQMLFEPVNEFKDLTNANTYNTYWVNNGDSYKYPTHKLTDIRTAYEADFQFIYDKTTGYYTYNSAINHAQFVPTGETNDKGLLKGEVVLYADTLGTSNATLNQLANIDTGIASNGNYNKLGVRNSTDNGYYSYNKPAGMWTIVSGNASGDLRNTGYVRYLMRQDTADITVDAGNEAPAFSPLIRMKKINARYRNDSDAISVGIVDSVKAEQVKYLYLKFRVGTNESDSNAVNYNFGKNTLTVKFAEVDSGSYDTTFTHDYNCTDDGWVELYIDVSKYVEDGNTIGSILLNPFTFSGKNEKYTINVQDCVTNNKTAEFGLGKTPSVVVDIAEFALMYTPDNDSFETYSRGQFLPFHRIQDSYVGVGEENSYTFGMSKGSDEKDEEYEKRCADAVIYKWTDIKDTKVLYSNRSIINNCNVGLETLDTVKETNTVADKNNSFGGTASHFGLSMSTEFFIPLDRTTGIDSDGNGEKDEIIFEFLGDDDMWVFIDDILVLDIGGSHWAVEGSINLTKGEVNYAKVPYILNSSAKLVQGTASNQTRSVAHDGTTNLYNLFSPGKHTLKIFYLERASGLSNCYISFNLPQIPEGALTVSNSLGESTDSELKVPHDLNNDGYDDFYLDNDISNDLVIYNNNGKLGYKDSVGNVVSEKMITCVYEAEYIVPKAYVDGGKYSAEYSLYKTDSPDDTVVSGLNFTSVIEDSTSNFYKYIVRFEVPVGYTASIFMPEDSVITRVLEVNPFDTSGIDSKFAYSGTQVSMEGTKLTQEDKYSLLNDGLTGYGNIKLDANTALNLQYKNNYRAELYDLTIEKKFKAGDPVPVGQSILFKVEGGNIDPNDPLYVNMLIKDPGNGANPNVVTVTDLPKGNYTVTEISDWSWRYVCYNVLVQRDNNTVASGNGTIIGVNPIPESKG